jgi:hypothetical protein
LETCVKKKIEIAAHAKLLQTILVLKNARRCQKILMRSGQGSHSQGQDSNGKGNQSQGSQKLINQQDNSIPGAVPQPIKSYQIEVEFYYFAMYCFN